MHILCAYLGKKSLPVQSSFVSSIKIDCYSRAVLHCSSADAVHVKNTGAICHLKKMATTSDKIEEDKEEAAKKRQKW